MSRFVEGVNRQQAELLPAMLDDYVDEDNQVRVIDVRMRRPGRLIR